MAKAELRIIPPSDRNPRIRGYYYETSKQFFPIVIESAGATPTDFEVRLNPPILAGGKKTSSQYITYNKKKYKVKMGSRGGKYIIVDDKKMYIK
jgi:hypothetical protein